MLRTRCYRGGQVHSEGFKASEISDHLSDTANTIWFDLLAPDAAELDVVREELGLHALAVEDVLQSGQRPKVDHYAEHLFVVAYAVDVDPSTKEVRSHEAGIFITANAVVTVRADDGFDIDEVVRRWDESPSLARSGAPFLLHGVLDYVVDTHFGALQIIDSEVDALEDRLFDDVTSDAAMQRRTFQLRKSLVELRRVAVPMREVVHSLMRPDLRVVDERMAPYFGDINDHVLQVAEWTDSLRDLLGNILETRLTVRSNRLNVIMKKVTSWAAIIAVPTAVTGFYGQNLPYPGSGQVWGFWISTLIILAASTTLFVVFKRKDWL
jgi:magnesium transporter